MTTETLRNAFSLSSEKVTTGRNQCYSTSSHLSEASSLTSPADSQLRPWTAAPHFNYSPQTARNHHYPFTSSHFDEDYDWRPTAQNQTRPWSAAPRFKYSAQTTRNRFQEEQRHEEWKQVYVEREAGVKKIESELEKTLQLKGHFLSNSLRHRATNDALSSNCRAGTSTRHELPIFHVQKVILENDGEKRPDDLVDAQILAMQEMQRLRSTYGKFSYSLFPEELIVNLEDDKAYQNEKVLRAALAKVCKHFFKGQSSVSVKVCRESLGGVLCSPAIGANLEVNRKPQTAGMYVLNQGAVYWVSAAHNFFRIPQISTGRTPRSDNHVVAATDEIASRGVRIEFEREELVAHDDPFVPSPMAYPCLEHKPIYTRGRHLENSVDIMIGQVPMVAKRNAQQSVSLDSLWEVRQCAHCPAIDCGHENANVIYRIEEVLKPTLFARENIVFYSPVIDETYKDYKNVRTVLPGRNIVTGVIERSLLCPVLNGEIYNNAIFIRSTNGVSPRLGDSGSVWVTENPSKAVAITVGKIKNPRGVGGEVWVGLFLFPCLEVLCQQHEQSFPDVRELKSINGNVLVSH